MQRPDHIALIGACLTLWPDIDMECAMLLAALTRANSSAIVAVYSVLRRATGKFEALSAAANVSLDKSGVEIVNAIISVIQSLEAERNDFAHGHWGVSDLIPEGILWIDGKYSIDYHVRHRLIGRGHSLPELESRVFYYTKDDFERFRDSVFSLCENIRFLRRYLDRAPSHLHLPFRIEPEARARLEADGPISQALLHQIARERRTTP